MDEGIIYTLTFADWFWRFSRSTRRRTYLIVTLFNESPT